MSKSFFAYENSSLQGNGYIAMPEAKDNSCMQVDCKMLKLGTGANMALGMRLQGFQPQLSCVTMSKWLGLFQPHSVSSFEKWKWVYGYTTLNAPDLIWKMEMRTFAL